MWGDAHSLPFKDQSFDCVLSYAVLEHLHAPWVAIHEVARILKPGGIYIGSVSQGEPFHHSYFHHTPWAMCSLIALCPELSLERIRPSMDTLRSLSRMGRYPRVIQKALKLVESVNRRCPWLAPRRMRWSQQEKDLDQLYRAGSLCFLVRRHQHSVNAE
jgi:ubiquinone/menaquinone biosynthesis C-methylase UbiE